MNLVTAISRSRSSGVFARSIHHNLKIRYGANVPIMVFTAGAPGSGKTFCLNKIFGLENIDLTLDLDLVMPHHPDFDSDEPHVLYEQEQAYDWANKEIERKFLNVLQNRKDFGLVCFDGTGTHVRRQKRRMRAAKDAGFWVVNLFVKVSLETAMIRNKRRKRTVPDHILREYVEKLPESVSAITNAPGLCDEMLEYSNDDDDGQSARDRWGSFYDEVWRNSALRKSIFE